MRYSEIKTLLEYDRSITAQNLGAKLSAAVSADNLFWRQVQNLPQQEQINAILEKLEEMDPTPQKKYVQWLAKQYINKQFRLEDAPRVNKILSYFIERDIIRDFKRRGLKLDINQYDYRTLRQEIVASAEGGIDQEQTPPDSTGQINYKNIKDMNVLYSGNLGQLIVPKTEAASCEIGAGTEWCTAWDDDNQFDNYNKDGPLYAWIEPNGTKYQFHFESSQFMDKNDDPLDSTQIKYFREQNPITAKLFKTKEKNILNNQDPSNTVKYAREVLGGRWPEAEPVIVKDGAAAYEYAQRVIKGRWPEAEPVIAKDAMTSQRYARLVIKGRWPEAEPVIIKDAKAAEEYALFVIKGRWPAAEPTIVKDAQAAQRYAQYVIKGRWPAAEPAIVKDAKAAADYARRTIKGKWPAAEPTIVKDADAAEEYAQFVINGRWPEAEPVIVKDAQAAQRYAQNVIKGRWPEAEPVIATDPYASLFYDQFVKKINSL